MPLSPATDDSGDDAPPPSAAGAPPAAAAAGGGSDGSRSSSRSGPPRQAEASGLPAPEAVDEEDEEAASAQSGGAEGAMVTSEAGGKRKRAPEYKFVSDQHTNKTKMVRVNQRGEGTIMQIVKPYIHEASDEKDRKLAHMFEFVDVLRNRERNLKIRADDTGGGDGVELTPHGSKPTVEELRLLGMPEALPGPVTHGGLRSLYGRATFALPKALIAELERDWHVEIRHDVRDVDGNLFVPGGANKGTMCGAFPHGIRTLSSGVFSGVPCYQIAGNRDVSVQVRLVRKHCVDPTQWTEQAVLSKIRAVVPEAEQRQWGAHESALSFHMRVRFDDGSPIVASRDAATTADGFSFKADVATGHLLKPAEGRPGDGGFYDFAVTNNKGIREGFYFNAGATHTKLVHGKASKKWVFDVFPLNPYLAQVKSFYAVSVPFCVKSSLAPAVGGQERYVYDGEGAPPRQVPNHKAAFKAQMTRRAAQ